MTSDLEARRIRITNAANAASASLRRSLDGLHEQMGEFGRTLGDVLKKFRGDDDGAEHFANGRFQNSRFDRLTHHQRLGLADPNGASLEDLERAHSAAIQNSVNVARRPVRRMRVSEQQSRPTAAEAIGFSLPDPKAEREAFENARKAGRAVVETRKALQAEHKRRLGLAPKD